MCLLCSVKNSFSIFRPLAKCLVMATQRVSFSLSLTFDWRAISSIPIAPVSVGLPADSVIELAFMHFWVRFVHFMGTINISWNVIVKNRNTGDLFLAAAAFKSRNKVKRQLSSFLFSFSLPADIRFREWSLKTSPFWAIQKSFISRWRFKCQIWPVSTSWVHAILKTCIVRQKHHPEGTTIHNTMTWFL